MKFLIIDEMHPSIIPLLKSIGIEPTYLPKIKKEEVGSALSGYDGLVVRSKLRVDYKLLEFPNQLKVVCRAGAGVDNIDEEALAAKKIHLINAPEGNRDAVAEHTLAMILSLLNNIQKADKEVRNRIWDREGNRGYELKDKCVALFGYGYMGKAVAKRLKSFGCKVLAYDKYLHNFTDEYVEESSLEKIFEYADFLSLHVPLTSETKSLVDYNFVNNFRKNIWFINTARGEIVPLKDLVRLLEKGKVKGAALDVLENEKLSSLTPEQEESLNYLVNSNRVLLSPHVGGWTFESYERINEVIVEKLKLFAKQG